MSRLTKPQMRALDFFEKSERDPTTVFGKAAPATKTTNWLVCRLYVDCRSVGAFDMKAFRLSDKGRAALRGKDHGTKTADV
jgi:hypothetical protein